MARWAMAVAIGVVTLTLYGPDAAGWLSPGPLTAAHTQIGDCATCHQEFDGGPTGWVHAAFSGPALREGSDSAMCLSCHKTGAEPMKPHGVPDDRLRRATAGADGRSGPFRLEFAEILMGSPADHDGGLACASCHGEHEGRDADLTVMGNDRCQSCHARKFRSFSEGHPEFGAWPYERRTRINFDHVTHVRRHFEDADAAEAPTGCVDCHQSDDQGRSMIVRGFETACASCHVGEVRGDNATGSTGIPVITVPGLDVLSLREAGARIGEWPELSDRELTPFMRAVFASDPELSDALERFRSLDPLDLRDAGEADIEAVERIAWATKNLIHDLVADGPPTLRPAVASGLGRNVERARAGDLLGGMSLDTVRQARAEWFPALAEEIARHRDGESVPMPGTEESAATDRDPAGEDASPDDVASGDDILGGDEDTGGGGDDILGGEETSGGGGDGILGGEEMSGDDDDILGATQAQGRGGDDILGGTEPAGNGSDDILGGDAPEADGAEDILGGGTSGGGEGLFADGDQAGSDTETMTATMPNPDPEQWGRLGGWYRDFYALLYRPGGHADRFLTGWLDLAGSALEAGNAQPAGAVFERLASPDGPGRCTKCHSVDERDGGGMRVNWGTASATPGYREFTEFDHGPHFTLLTDDEGCATCHSFDRENDYAASFDDRDPDTYHSNFEPIERRTCEGCHNEQQAGNTCTQCHNYHVGRVGSEPTNTRFEGMESP